MQITLVDFNTTAFYPFSQTRAISHLQVVGGSIAQLWSKFLPDAAITHHCLTALSSLYPQQKGVSTVYVDSRVVPTKALAQQVLGLSTEGVLVSTPGQVLAANSAVVQMDKLAIDQGLKTISNSKNEMAEEDAFVWLDSANDLFIKLGYCFRQFDTSDFQQYSDNKNGVFVSGDQFFVHPEAKIHPGYYDTTSGPIVVDKDAEVAAGAMLKGPIYVGEHAVVKMGAKVYGPTVIGKEGRAGGEISNCNIGAYSNKGHDGFIGNAVIGEWCNLGADTNCSNLKNNYSKVKQYQHATKAVEQTEMQFCGVLMGDHSKTAINTQINTASVFGAFSNAVCSSFPPKHLPNFSWYTDKGLSKFELEKAYEMAEAMMARRNVSLTDETKALWRFLAQ